MDGGGTNGADRLGYASDSSKVSPFNGDDSSTYLTDEYPTMVMPESISFAGNSKDNKEITSEYLHGEFYGSQPRMNDINSDNYAALPQKLTIDDSSAYQNKPTWNKRQSRKVERPVRSDELSVDKESASKTEVSAEYPVVEEETIEVQENEPDYRLNYEEFMELSDKDKILDLYYRLRDQEDKLKVLESRLRNRESSSSMFGGVTGLILSVSSILALAYVYRKKLQL